MLKLTIQRIDKKFDIHLNTKVGSLHSTYLLEYFIVTNIYIFQ